MVSKNEFKYIQSLCHKKQRQQDGLFIAETPKLLDEILNSNYTVKNIYATAEWINEQTNKYSNITEVSEQELARMSSLQSPNKVLAIVEQKPNKLPVTENQFNLLLDGIQDPGNLGTIIRIADWFGIKNILCSNDTADCYNNKVVQSTMGSLARVNIWYGNVAEELLEQNKLPVYGAVLNGHNVYTTRKNKAAILIIGNEGNGIRDNIQSFITNPVTIPRVGGAESLNAAVATGIILSHLI